MKNKKVLIIGGAGYVGRAVGSEFLDKGYGALGLAYAFVMSYLFHSIVQIYYSYKYLLVDVK